tara:strand:+ start:161 stop:1612 length:1452 start_codon:yes stop_codon:yes gene_type:complete
MDDTDSDDDLLVPAKRRKVTPLAAIKVLVASVATMTRAEVQVEWTKLRGETRRPGGKSVYGVGLLQEALRERNLGVCTTCNTVKTAGEMYRKTNYCNLCNPNTKTGKARIAENNRRVAAERASCVQNRDDSAIGSRFEEWLAEELRKRGFIVQLNYEFCRADLLLKRPNDTKWFRIQAKGSETNPAIFDHMFGYGSQAKGVKEPDHRMLVVCGRKDGEKYTLWMMDGGEILSDYMKVSKADILSPDSLKLAPTTLDDIVAQIHKDLEQRPPTYPLTTEDAAELDIQDLKQLKEKVLMLALKKSGKCKVWFRRGNQTCIDCYTIINDDQWMATQTKTHNFRSGKANAFSRVNRAARPYAHDCGIERMLEGAIIAKKEDGEWIFYALYAYQDYEALKANVFSNLKEDILGNTSIYTRFQTDDEAKKWAGVTQTKSDCRTTWLTEPRHCFNRVRVDPDERLTRDLLWKCTSWFVDADGNGKPEPPK